MCKDPDGVSNQQCLIEKYPSMPANEKIITIIEEKKQALKLHSSQSIALCTILLILPKKMKTYGLIMSACFP